MIKVTLEVPNYWRRSHTVDTHNDPEEELHRIGTAFGMYPQDFENEPYDIP